MELLSKTDLSVRWGVSKQVVQNWSTRHSNFPKNSYTVDGGRTSIYTAEDIENYEKERGLIKMTNIKGIIKEIENGTIELEGLDPNYHEIECIDGAAEHYIVHKVEGHEDLEVYFAEHDHIKEVRNDVYENEEDEAEAFEELTINEYADQYDYDKVVAYRHGGEAINWL